MSGTELVLLEGRPGDEDGNGWQPALTLDHGGPGHHELFVIVGEEAAGMAEHDSCRSSRAVPMSDMNDRRERLALRALAKMVFEEFPGSSIGVIVDTWTAPGITSEECRAVRELEQEGVFVEPDPMTAPNVETMGRWTTEPSN